MTESVLRVESFASGGRPRTVRGFVAVMQVGAQGLTDGWAMPSQELGHPACCHVSRDRRLHVRVLLRRSETPRAELEPASGPSTLVLGTNLEWRASSVDDACMAAGATVRYDLERTRLTVRTSIVGLPPVFVCQTPSRVVVASDLWLLKSVPGIRFDFDREGVIDLCRIGYPIGFRTLFEGIRVVPGGSRLDVDAQGHVKVTAAWAMPEDAPLNSWDSYTGLQIEAFSDAVRRVDGEGSFLSLTAGLDTRTMLAALLCAGRTVPACTMSWKDVTLDARTAGALCRRYGIEHRVVRFDDAFAKDLPDYALRASCLSGGLASIWEATEVAFYESIGTRYRTRLSGYLGNQVGRGGVEQVRPRNGDPTILGADLRPDGTRPDQDDRVGDEAGTEPRRQSLHLMLRDVLFASIGNYGIGNHFSIQESPYADRSMIETLAQMPRELPPRGDLSVPRMRLRDLLHRFVGEVEDRSFQRKLVKAVGGYVAECPVNWGWRVSGGMEAKGLGLGILALLDMAASSRTLQGSRIGRALEALPTTGRHDFRQPRKWCSPEFVQDTLRATEVRESGILDMETIGRMLLEHFGGKRDHFGSLMLAMDLAHACRVFVCDSHEDVVRYVPTPGAASGVRPGEAIELAESDAAGR